MPAITASVTLRIPGDLLERVDERRGGTSRNAWLVWAVERALEESGGLGLTDEQLRGGFTAVMDRVDMNPPGANVHAGMARPFKGSYDPFKKR